MFAGKNYDAGWVTSFIAVYLLILIGAVYFNSIGNPFHYDDILSIKRNPGLEKIANLKLILQPKEYYELFGERTYRPVTSAIYIILKQVFQNNPALWRLFNLFLHLANCLLLYLLFEMFGLKKNLSLLAVSIFAVHTVHTEIFNVVSYNEDLIGGLFSLLALLFYFKKGFFWRGSSLLLYLLSCFTKETFVLLPFLIFLISWQYEEDFTVKRQLKNHAPYLLLALLFLFVNFHLMRAPSGFMKPIYPGGSLRTALQTFAVTLMYYFKIFFWPLGLTPNYDFFTYNTFNLQVGASILFLALIAIAIFLGLVRKAEFAPYLAWYFLYLMPTSNIIPYGGILAERYLYFPLMGLVMGLLLLTQSLLARFHQQRLLYGLGIAFVVFLSIQTVKRNAVWSDPISIWGDALSKTRYQNDFISLSNLASAYDEAGEYDKAIHFYKLAIKADPMWPFTYRDLGRIYWRTKKFKQAREQFDLALARKRGFLERNEYYDLLIDQGALCLKLEDYQGALEYWLRAEKEQPDNPRTYQNLRLAYRKLGLMRQANEANAAYQSLRRQKQP